MKNLFRLPLAAATLLLALSSSAFASEASEAGYVDFGKFSPAAKGQFVEVNLSSGMLKFAAKIAGREEPEAAELISNLKRVRVNVVSLDDGNRANTMEKMELLRHELEAQGWAKMVTVREQKGDNVDVHVKQHGEDAIDGLVVTVLNEKGEAVFVNIVGNITADQINKIADKFDIEPLRKVHVKFDHKHKASDKEDKDV